MAARIMRDMAAEDVGQDERRRPVAHDDGVDDDNGHLIMPARYVNIWALFFCI